MKSWLSIADAAKYLASTFREEVNEADVLHFALEGDLTLSVHFINGAQARLGLCVPIEGASYEEITGLEGEPVRFYEGPLLNRDGVKSHVIQLEKRITTLQGIWDLPMIGGEKITVQSMYQQLTGGPDATNISWSGAFVGSTTGDLYQLQNDFDENEYCSGSTASLEKIKKYIKAKKIESIEAEKFLNEHKEHRKKFLEERKEEPHVKNFYPGDLPQDTVFVVRTKALIEFIQLVNAESIALEKPLGNRERDTLLSIMAVLCKEAKLDHTKHAKTAGLLQATATLMGISIGESTIEGHLKKISAALATRIK